jgi:cell division protease FtsH
MPDGSQNAPKTTGGRNRKRQEPPAPPLPPKGILAWAIVLAMVLLMVQLYSRRQEARKEIPYNPDFITLVAGNEQKQRIRNCEIVQDPGAEYVRGEIVADDGKTPPQRFRVNVVRADEDLQKFLIQHGVRFTVVRPNPYILQIVTSALPVILIFGILYFLFMRQVRAAGHGALSFGKSRARLLSRDRNKVTFENVAGIDEAKEEVQEIIEFLKDPKKFQRLGGRIPKGVLLMGPPGTGKTLLAKAIAGEADVPFFSISGSDFVEMFVGVGASRVRDMFEQAKKSAPCIVFIDEIDAVGRSRFTGIGGGHDEREQTLNALLVEMDGFETQEGVIIIAATNRPDVLDPALLRPGRFDRQIVIDLPTIEGRTQILTIHAKNVKLADPKDLRRIARGTSGFSGADLENLLNEAALLAARQNKEAVGLPELEEARDKVMWGRERRSRVMDEKEKRTTAYHEAGHALVQVASPETEPVHKVTIIPRGLFLGATMSLPEKDRYNQTRGRLSSELAVLMGGRAAEEAALGDITTGAQSDIKEATRLARLMVCNWGMSNLGPQRFSDNQEVMFLGREITRQQNFSEETSRRIDGEVTRLLDECYRRARGILDGNREKLDTVARLLLERETLDGRDVLDIYRHGRILPEAERDEAEKRSAGAAAAGGEGETAGPRPPPLPGEAPAPGAGA